MPVTLPVKGSLNWDISLNAALTYLDNNTTSSTSSALQKANNLSDLTNVPAARTALGISTSTTYNVKDYGATGNGSTNDYTALQNAINAAGTAGGGTVFLPTGTYIIGTPLALPPGVGVQIVGSGWSTIIKLANGVNDYAFKFNGLDTRMKFADLTIDGNCANQTGGGGIQGNGAVSSLFTNLHLTNCYNYGIVLGPITGGAFGHSNRVVNCLFDNGTTSAGRGGALMFTSSDENIINSCDFEFLGGSTAPVGTNSVAVYDAAGTNFFVACNWVGGASGNNCIGIRIQNASHSRITGCNFDGTAGDSIFIAGSANAITGNTIFSPGQVGTAGAASGIHLEFGATGNSVVGNVVSSATTNGVTRSLIREENVGSSGSNQIISNQLITVGTLSVSVLDLNAPGTQTRGNLGGGAVGDTLTSVGSVSLTAAGQGIKLTEGTNAKMGITGAMTAGTITVSTTAVTANSRIFLTAQNTGGTAGALRVSTITAGTSFVITSSSNTDTSTVAWLIVDHT